MAIVSQLRPYVIGDEDVVSGFRLAGITDCYIVKAEEDARENVPTLLSSLFAQPGVGVIVIQEDYASLAEDAIRRLREERRLFPLIVEVPSKRGARHKDVVAYYRALIRRFVGFDAQI